MKYAEVTFKKTQVTIRTVVTEAEQHELRRHNTLDGAAVTEFHIEHKNGHPKGINIALDSELGRIFKAIGQAYGVSLWTRVFRRMLLDTAANIASQPRPKDLTPVQKQGYLYLEKATIELSKEIKKHGKTKKRVRGSHRPNLRRR